MGFRHSWLCFGRRLFSRRVGIDMQKIIGVIMLVSLFTGLFVHFAIQTSILIAALNFLGAIAAVSFVCVAIYLIMG